MIQTIFKNELTRTPVVCVKRDGVYVLCGWEYRNGEFLQKEIELGDKFPTGKEIYRMAREYFFGNECAGYSPDALVQRAIFL